MSFTDGDVKKLSIMNEMNYEEIADMLLQSSRDELITLIEVILNPKEDVCDHKYYGGECINCGISANNVDRQRDK